MRNFWPVCEAAQADYEGLREAALAGVALCDVTARRFERAGLAGLIVRPSAKPGFMVSVAGATRPPWTPYADPRIDALADTYLLLVEIADRQRRTASDQGSLMSSMGAAT
jgi:hypothetical protein